MARYPNCSGLCNEIQWIGSKTWGHRIWSATNVIDGFFDFAFHLIATPCENKIQCDSNSKKANTTFHQYKV